MAISAQNKTDMITAAAAMDTAITNLATAYNNLLTPQAAALDVASSLDAAKIEQATGPARLKQLIAGRFRSAGIIELISGWPAAAEAVASIETAVTNLLG